MSIKITPIEITDEEIGAVKQKTPDKLPDRPTDAGWGAARIKAFLTSVLVDENTSLLSLLKSVVNRANESLSSIVEQIDSADEERAESLEEFRSSLKELGAAIQKLDDSIHPWAREAKKPTYTFEEVGAMPAYTLIPKRTSDLHNDGSNGDAFASVNEVNTVVDSHNLSRSAHSDIREIIAGISNRLNAVLDSDDTTLDELSEIVAYIKSNKELIDAITTTKINIEDIVDNLYTDTSYKPLSASQGVKLAGLIAALTEKFENLERTDGKDGKDGIPATHSWNGTVLTITSASGTSSVDLKGDPGPVGKDGANGKDGYTPIVGIDYFTPSDKETLMSGVLSALPTWNGGSY